MPPAHAQQSEPMRRIGVLMSTAAEDPEGKTRIGALLQGIRQISTIARGPGTIESEQ
jgi:hypothetical protein